MACGKDWKEPGKSPHLQLAFVEHCILTYYDDGCSPSTDQKGKNDYEIDVSPNIINISV